MTTERHTRTAIVLHWLMPLPDFVPADRELAETLKLAHRLLAWVLGAVVASHIAAALKDAWVNRDGLLRRMGS